MVSSVASQPMPACDVSVMYGPRCPTLGRDRKSTRLNSSHLGISYAVFCLKKKKKKLTITLRLKRKTLPTETHSSPRLKHYPEHTIIYIKRQRISTCVIRRDSTCARNDHIS